MALSHESLPILVQLNLLFSCQLLLLYDFAVRKVKYFIHVLDFHEFFTHFLGEKLRIDLGLVWIFGVFDGEVLLLVLLDQVYHGVLGFYLAEALGLYVVDALDQLNCRGSLVQIDVQTDFDEVIKSFLLFPFFCVELVK